MAECTIYDKLRYIAETKDLIKAAIEAQDVKVLESATFRQYAEYITEIRKVSSVNGMQGDVTITAADLGALTEIPSEYITETELNEKGYLTAVPSGYATEQWVNEQGFLKEHQDISNLATKSELDAKQDVINDLDSIRSGAAKGATALQSVPSEYITETELNEKGYLTAVPDVYITEDELSSQLADKVSQNGLNEAINGVRNDIPTNVSELTNDSGYITLNEVPKVDLSGYALKSEIPDISVKQDKLTAGNGISITDNVISLNYEYDLFEVVQSLPTENISDNKVYLVMDSNGSEGNTYVEYLYVNGQWEELGKFKVNIDLSGYATEDWVNSQGFLKEHQDISNLATKTELNTKQDTISDLDSIRSGAAKGATALQSVPSEYVTETELNNKGYLTSVPDTYALKSEIPDITTKQDTLVSGTNIKTINGNSLLGSGDITIEGGSGNVDLSDYYTKTETNELVNPKLEQVTLTQAEYDALQTKENNVLYIISDAEDLKFKTINGQHILGEGNIVIEASADNVPTLQTAVQGTTSNYVYSSGHADTYGIISDIGNVITYSTDNVSIRNNIHYWGSSAVNASNNWEINSATTSKAGLMSASDKTKLDGIDASSYATKTELATKQDTLVSGTNIKTVNGISLLGEGDITVSSEGVVDLSGYYTKAEIDAMIGGASQTITQINNLVV